MFEHGGIAFGDNVRIVDDEATRQSGHADLVGVCHGMTTPSVTGVDVIGNAPDDVALSVHFDDDTGRDAWFAPDLVALVDRAVGSRATVGERTFVKAADGSWVADVAKDRRKPHRRWFRRERA